MVLGAFICQRHCGCGWCMAILKSCLFPNLMEGNAPKIAELKGMVVLIRLIRWIAAKLSLRLHFKSFLMQAFKSSKGLTKELGVTSEGRFLCSKQPACNPPSAEDKCKAPLLLRPGFHPQCGILEKFSSQMFEVFNGSSNVENPS